MTDGSNLKGLPKTDPTESLVETPAIRARRVRICDKCGKEAQRVAATGNGVAAYCACGHWWAISARSGGGALPMAPPRGLSKETLVEPDWDKAFEDLEGVFNDEVGPKRKG